jgi:putative membrane protein
MSQLGGFMTSSERAMPWWRPALRWLVIALSVVIATHTSRGTISYTARGCLGPHGLGTLALVVLALSFFNMVLKPILILFTLPFVVLTLGLGLLVINALLFLLAAQIVPGFQVTGFWPACWGALVVSVMSLIANRWLGRRRFIAATRGLGGRVPHSPAARRDNDVIDV